MAARSIVMHTEEADVASRRAAPSQLDQERLTARRMVGEDAASTRAAPSQLQKAAHRIARRMAEADAASETAAS